MSKTKITKIDFRVFLMSGVDLFLFLWYNLLERAAENRIELLTRSQAYPMLLQQVYRPPDAGKMAKVLELLDRLAATAGLFRLGCNMDISAAEVAYNGMKG